MNHYHYYISFRAISTWTIFKLSQFGHVSSTLVEISARCERTQPRLIDRSKEHKGSLKRKKKKRGEKIRSHGIEIAVWNSYYSLGWIRRENRTDRKAERKRVPQRELRISWEKCEGKVSWMAFATIHSFHLLSRRSNSPLSAKPIGFPSILLDRSIDKIHRHFFFRPYNKLSGLITFQFVDTSTPSIRSFSPWMYFEFQQFRKIFSSISRSRHRLIFLAKRIFQLSVSYPQSRRWLL